MAIIDFIGQAAPLSEITTHTFGGTWSTNDTFDMTFPSGAVYTMTVGSTATASQIASEVNNFLSESSLGTGYSVTSYTLPPEFSGTEFDEASGVVTITGPPGRPFDITIDNPSGTGTITPSTVQSASGPSYASAGTSWAGGTAPTSGDTARFRGSVDVPCSYALDAIDDVDAIIIEQGYAGPLGLPLFSDDGYVETNPQYLVLAGDTNVTIGGGPAAAQAQLIRLDFDGNGGTINVLSTGSRLYADLPPVDVINLTGGTVNITTGEVWLRDCSGVTVNVTSSATVHLSGAITACTVAGGAVTSEGAITTLNIQGGVVVAQSTIGTLNGEGGTVDAQGNVTTANLYATSATFGGTVGTLNQTISGSVLCEGAVTTANISAGTCIFEAAYTTTTISGGTVTSRGAGVSTATTVLGGTFYYNSTGTLGTLTVEGSGVVDCRQALTSRTVANPVVLSGTSARVYDPARKIGSLEVDFHGSTAAQVDRGNYYTATYSAI